MFSTKFIAAAAATFSLISSSTAVYNPSSQRNLAMYWGSGSNQANLTYYCDQPNVDIIPIGFINIFPNQANGLVAETFGNQCWDGNYTGPGYNGVNNPGHDYLYKQCPLLQESLYYCQQKTNKKILLSLGGAAGDYYLNGAADGVYLANFLWGAYGPYNSSWKGVRPLDRGYYNTDTSETIDFDGFDFDIEQTSPDQQLGYIACINRLRELFAEHKSVNPCSKDYIISGAPQCPLDEPYMSTAIAGAKFDVLWIQFYNNGANGCTARNYADSVAAKKTSGFNYDSWVTKVNAGKSAGAKLYIGLLAGQAASSGSPNDYINAADAKTLITQYHSHAQFGGVMLYEATVAENNAQFYNQIKAVLNSVAAAGTVTSSATVCSSTTSSSSSKTSYTSTSITSLTSSKPISTSASSTSSKPSSSSSSSSSSVKPTSSSTSLTSSSASSSSSSSTLSSSSSLSSSTSSSVLSSSSSSSTLSSSSSSSLSSSSSSVISSSTSVPVSSTSTSSDVSLPPTSTPTPTTVPSVGTCAWIGCYSEATSVRALSGATYVNDTLMSVEICSAFCKGFAYFGVEYGGECYCGDSFGDGSTVQPTIDCSQTCDGTPTELCGAGNRLDVYQCGNDVSSSSVVSSSTSSTISVSSSVSLTSSSSVVSPTPSSSVSSTLDSSTSIVSPTPSSTLSSSSSIVSPTPSSTLSSSSSIVSSSSVSSSESSSIVSSSSVSSDTSSSVVPTSSIYSSSSVSSTLSSSSSSITPSSSASSGTSSVYPTTSGVYTNSTSSTSTKKSVCTRKTKTTSSSVTLSSSSAPYSNSSSTSVSVSGTGSFTPTSSGTVPTSSGTSTSSGGGIVSTASSASISGSSSVSGTGSSSISGTATSSGGGIVSSPSPTSYTTSTVYTTSVYTITSCAATVTNCPALIGSVTTETIVDYTTVCPVTATETGKGYPTTTPATQTAGGYPTSSPSVTAYTTSTVYKTTTYTITSCAATVTNCPARIGSVTTEVVVDYTTVCPVTATETYPVVASSSAYLPGKGGKVTYSATPASSFSEGTGKTTTISSTTTSYVTVKYVQSTATIVPVPVSASSSSAASVSTLVVVSSVEVAPYPTGAASGVVSSVVGTGTGVPVVKGVSTSTYAGVATSSPTSTQFTGAAASVKGSWGLVAAVVVGLVVVL